jgi:polygalacturonase
MFMSTPFIQAAIDACGSEEGGAVVLFPPGMYLTGTIFVKSNITLYIAEGATVLGSSQQKDFPPDAARWYTILAENASNVAITGINCRSIMSLKLTLKLRTTISCASDMVFLREEQQNCRVEQKSKSSFEFDFQHEDKL